MKPICITISNPSERALAKYSFEEAFLRLGLPRRIVEGEPTEDMVVYGPKPPNWCGPALPYDKRCYDPKTRFTAVGSPPCWVPEGSASEGADLVGGIGRLLTLTDEAQVVETARDAKGIFLTRALPSARARVAQEPLVEHNASAFGWQLEMLVQNQPKPCPRWPAGRRYAVVVTHDTDAVALDAPMEILANAAKAALQHDLIRARMTWDGITKRHNPLAAFETWAQIEGVTGLHSAFFIFARGIVPSHLNDCRSSLFNRRTNWDRLRNLIDEGWEFGYHAPIRAKERIDEFTWAKNALTARFGRPVYGVRHHYWALDWRRPYLTHRKHADAGFLYDSSIAWRDTPGFRAGTCLPYRPFDPDRGHDLAFYELPNTIMDGHVIVDGGDIDAAMCNALSIVESVRQVNGMLVLDWHTETALDGYCYRNQRTVLMKLLAKLREDSDAWFVTPLELTRHWIERSRALCPDRVAL